MSSEDKKELLTNQVETSIVEQSNQNIATSSLISNESINLKPKKKQPNDSSMKSQVQRDYEQLNRFLSPMLDDLDKLVASNLKEMDRMEEFVLFFLNC
jgi:hypothetical protein